MVLSFPSHQRTHDNNMWWAVSSVLYRRFCKTRPRVHRHHVWPSNPSSGSGSGKEEPQEACQLILRMVAFILLRMSWEQLGIGIEHKFGLHGTANKSSSAKNYNTMPCYMLWWMHHPCSPHTVKHCSGSWQMKKMTFRWILPMHTYTPVDALSEKNVQ